jgi:hypothetical protein
VHEPEVEAQRAVLRRALDELGVDLLRVVEARQPEVGQAEQVQGAAVARLERARLLELGARLGHFVRAEQLAAAQQVREVGLGHRERLSPDARARQGAFASRALYS